MNVPATFRLMAHTITVKVYSRREWAVFIKKHKQDEVLGLWFPDENQIHLMRQPRTQLMHAFCHEFQHAMLDMLSHPQARDEAFVDQSGGLLAQMLMTADK